eukprot:399760-Prymnesium_polylepis.1
MTPMPSTRTTGAFSAGSAPGSSGFGKKSYIPHSKCLCSKPGSGLYGLSIWCAVRRYRALRALCGALSGTRYRCTCR